MGYRLPVAVAQPRDPVRTPTCEPSIGCTGAAGLNQPTHNMQLVTCQRYTLSTRFVIPVNISQAIVPAFVASSEARIVSLP
jgi:hypothetical protein